jgi:hypothetical protein
VYVSHLIFSRSAWVPVLLELRAEGVMYCQVTLSSLPEIFFFSVLRFELFCDGVFFKIGSLELFARPDFELQSS